MNQINIYTDGGSRGNPGKAACAFVAYEGETEITRQSKHLGIVTNNVAEYSGVLLALQWVLEREDIFKNQQITFYLDSELVVKQINGVYKVKDQKMFTLFSEIKKIIDENNLIVLFKNVPREMNKVADSLVNIELDKIG